MELRKQKKIPIKRNPNIVKNTTQNDQLNFHKKFIQNRRDKEVSNKINQYSSNNNSNNSIIGLNTLNRSNTQNSLNYLSANKTNLRTGAKNLLNSNEKYEEKIKSRLSKSIIVSKDVTKKESSISNNLNNTNSKYINFYKRNSFLGIPTEEKEIMPNKLSNNYLSNNPKNNFLYSSLDKKPNNAFLKPNLSNFDNNNNQNNKLTNEIRHNNNYADSNYNKNIINNSRNMAHKKVMSTNLNDSVIIGLNNHIPENANKILIKNGQIFKLNSNLAQNVENFQTHIKKNIVSNQPSQRVLNGFNIIPTNQATFNNIKPAGFSQPLPLNKINNFKYPSSSILQTKKGNNFLKK